MAEKAKPTRRVIHPLRPDQFEIARHPARFKVVACGRRWGKTSMGLRMVQLAISKWHRQVWWVAPSYSLAFHPWLILKAAFKDQWELKLESERYIELPEGGSVTVKTADNPDLLRGVGLDFVIVDEAAYVDRRTWEAVLLPALSDRQGRALLISTPRGRNWFWEAFQRGQDPLIPDWHSWHYPTSANPIISPGELDQMKMILPDRTFRQEYLAEFIEDGGVVFRGVQQAATVPLDPSPVPVAGHRTYMGVDFGRYVDFTALAVIDVDRQPAPWLVALDRFTEVNWSKQRERIAKLAHHWQVETILAEANAMGQPNIEALRDMGLPVESFVTTPKSKGPLIESLVKAIEEQDVRLLPDPVLIGELGSYTYDTVRHTGHTRYFAPPGLHDDTVIALALAWQAASRPRLMLGIAVV